MYFVEPAPMTFVTTSGGATNYPAWERGADYALGATVSYGGSNYRSLYALYGYYNTVEPPLAPWYWKWLGSSVKALYSTSLELPAAIFPWTSGEVLIVGNCRVSGSNLFKLKAAPPNWTTAPAVGAYWTLIGAVANSGAITWWSPGVAKVANSVIFDSLNNHCYRVKSTLGSTTIRPSVEIVAQPTYWDDLGVWRRISDYGEWNSGDTIAAGECRFDPSTMRDYYCTTGLSETDNTRPPSALVKSQNPSEASLWYDMGPANAFRVYDREIISTMGSDEQSMWTLFKTTGGQLTDTIGVFGMRSIQTIRVRAWSLAQNAFVDTPIFDETRDVRYNELDYIGKSAATFRLSSPMYGAQIRVDATRFAFYTPSLTSRIAIGVVEAGLAIDMGSTITEFETTSADFSTKTTDEFGVVRIVQRGYARQVTCDVVIKTANLDGWKRRLDSYRATPCMYNLNNSGTSYESLILFGLYETARFKSQGLSESILSLSIKELTTS